MQPHIYAAFEKAGVTVTKATQSSPNSIEVEGLLRDGTEAEWTLSLHDGPSCYGYRISSCTENADETWEPIQADLMAGPKNHCNHVNDWTAYYRKRSQEPINLKGVRPEAIQAVLDALRGH